MYASVIMIQKTQKSSINNTMKQKQNFSHFPEGKNFYFLIIESIIFFFFFFNELIQNTSALIFSLSKNIHFIFKFFIWYLNSVINIYFHMCLLDEFI